MYVVGMLRLYDRVLHSAFCDICNGFIAVMRLEKDA